MRSRQRRSVLQRWEQPGLAPRIAPRVTVRERAPDAGLLDAADAGSRIETLSGLQATAGNRAVTALLDGGTGEAGAIGGGDVATFTTKAAPKGLREVSDEPPATTMRFGHTKGTFDSAPPLFDVTVADGTGGQKTAKVKKPIPSQAPDHTVSVVGAGRHVQHPGAEHKRTIVVPNEWADAIRKGEQEHVDDETLAWQLTWKAISDALTAVAADEPVSAATADAAREAAWAKVLDRLPRWLHPRDSSEGAQLRAWALRGQPTSPVSLLVTASKRYRDKPGGWHQPGLDPAEPPAEGEAVQTVTKGDSRIGEKQPAKLIAEANAELEAAAIPPARPKSPAKRPRR